MASLKDKSVSDETRRKQVIHPRARHLMTSKSHSKSKLPAKEGPRSRLHSVEVLRYLMKAEKDLVNLSCKLLQVLLLKFAKGGLSPIFRPPFEKDPSKKDKSVSDETRGKQVIQPRAESQQIAVWRLLY